MPNLINIDVSSLTKSISDVFQSAIKKKENLANIDKEVEKQIQDFMGRINDGQNAINLEESKSESLFKSGWRPAVAWICVAGLFWKFIAYPVFMFFNVGTPVIETDGLMELVMAMLGLAGIRSFDKKSGAK